MLTSLIKRKLSFFLTCTVLMIACLLSAGACKKEENLDPPSLNVSPGELVFEHTANDKRTITIETNGNWTINVEHISWLSIEYNNINGKGNSTIVLITKEANYENANRNNDIEIISTNDGGTVRETIHVVQKNPYPEGCTAEVTDEHNGVLRLTHGFACRIQVGNTTKYFRYHVYEANEYRESLEGDRENIEKAALTWERITPDVGGECSLYYDQCKPATKYMLVIMPYASDGTRGALCEYPLDTYKASDQPLARIEDVGMMEDKYNWNVVRDPGCYKYYTYVCASSSEFTSFKAAMEQSDSLRRGAKVAWELLKEMDFNSETHENTSVNVDAEVHHHDKFFQKRFENGPNEFMLNPTDKYLEIVTWGMSDQDGVMSGILYDVIYKIENKKLIPITNFDMKAMRQMDVSLTANPSVLTMPASGGQEQVQVQGQEHWTASSDATWCTVSPTNGISSTALTISVTENTTTQYRTATVTIKGTQNDATATIIVSQEAKTISPFIVTPKDLEFSNEGGSKEVTVECEGTWKVETTPSWCSFTKKAGGLTITVSANPTSNTREGDVKVIEVDGERSANIHITQHGSSPDPIQIKVTTLSIEPDGATKNIDVEGNESWHATSDASWCSVPQSGKAPGTLKITTSKNTTSSTRQAIVCITGDTSNHSYEITVKQDSYTITAEKREVNLTAAGTAQSVPIGGTDKFTASSSENWCSVSPTSGGPGGNITISATKNTTSAVRKATITIKGVNSGKEINITVAQPTGNNVGRDDFDGDQSLDGTTYTLSVQGGTTQLDFPATGDTSTLTKTLSILGNDGWSTLVANNGTSWCFPTTSGTAPGTLSVRVSPNNSSTQRSTTFVIRGSNSKKEITITVNQTAKSVVERDDFDGDKNL